MHPTRSLVLAVAALAFAACTRRQPEVPAKTIERAAGEELSDAQVIGILAAANDVEIVGGHQAEQLASAAPVQAFGKQMVTDHTALNHRGADLASRLGITALESPVSKQLREDGDRRLEGRSSLSGDDYDRAYIEDQVLLHATVLQAFDELLIPNAQNAELKVLISEARPQIAAHLEQARTLRARLGE